MHDHNYTQCTSCTILTY